MASLYGPHYEAIWREALILPGHDDLFASLASETAEYFGLAQEEAERRLVEAWERRFEVISAHFPKDSSEDSLEAYYSEHEHGIYDSMYWHSLRPDRYALHSVAGLHRVQQFAEGTRVFELGHGVGSTGILFARHGFELTLSDISESYRRFARHRFEARDLHAEFLDLTSGSPEPKAFDAVISFDVLEHIPDPLRAIADAWRCLKPGGVIVLNVAFGRDPNNPEHLLHRRIGVLDRIRQVGFERIASPSLLVYYKRELGRGRRAVYRLQDLADALIEDVAARWPASRPLLRISRPPPLG